MPLPLVLRRFLLVLVSLVALCIGVEIVCALALHLGYPYNWPLMFPNVSWMDFWYFIPHFSTFHTSAFYIGPDIIVYPAPVVLCYWFFYHFPHPTLVFLSLAGVTSFAGVILAGQSLERRGLSPRSTWLLLGTTYLLAFPWWFEFKQGNMEAVVWIILTIGLICFFKDRPWLAAIFFGVGASMKYYPIVFLGLLLIQKRYRQVVLGAVIAPVLILLSLHFMGPSVAVAWHGMQTGMAWFRKGFILATRPNEIGFDHSIFAAIKSVLAAGAVFHITPWPSKPHFSMMLDGYLWLMALIGTAAYFLRMRKLPLANQVLGLTVAIVLFPPLSFDYTLIHLYFPWLLLCFVALKAQREGTIIPGLRRIMICLAIAFSPLSEFILKHERFGGEIKCFVLIMIFYYSLRYPFPGSEPAWMRWPNDSQPSPDPYRTEAVLEPILDEPS